MFVLITDMVWLSSSCIPYFIIVLHESILKHYAQISSHVMENQKIGILLIISLNLCSDEIQSALVRDDYSMSSSYKVYVVASLIENEDVCTVFLPGLFSFKILSSGKIYYLSHKIT